MPRRSTGERRKRFADEKRNRLGGRILVLGNSFLGVMGEDSEQVRSERVKEGNEGI